MVKQKTVALNECEPVPSAHQLALVDQLSAKVVQVEIDSRQVALEGEARLQTAELNLSRAVADSRVAFERLSV